MKLPKKLLFVAAVSLVLTTPVHASLTSAQIDAVLSLLQSFNVPASTVDNVRTALQGGTPVISGTSSASSYTFSRNLTIGAKGSDVQSLQQFLNQSGCTVASSGPGSQGNETEYFGPATRTALACFQRNAGITPAVGYFGPVTRAAIEQSGPAESSTNATPDTTPNATAASSTVAVASGLSFTFSSNKTSIAPHNWIKLSWEAPSGATCTAGGGWTGYKNATGSQNLYLNSASGTYTLTCKKDGVSGTKSVTVTVGAAVPPDTTPPAAGLSLTLTASSNTTSSAGQSVTLYWSSNGLIPAPRAPYRIGRPLTRLQALSSSRQAPPRPIR